MTLIRLYEQLLNMYPKSFHDDYANEMSQVLRDMLADEQRASRKAIIWTRAFVELPASLLTANLHVLESAYTSTIPGYVVRNTRLSAALVVPFVTLIVFNELRPNILPSTPASTDVMQFFAIDLPLIAFIISTVTLLLWSFTRRNSAKTSTVRQLTDIKHNWPLVVVGGFAFAVVVFMVGRDSVQCLGSNPLEATRNFSATVQCINKV